MDELDKKSVVDGSVKKSSVEIGYIVPSRNSADGVKIMHFYYNASGKEIKYITFSYAPFNSVGDLVGCRISNKVEVSGRLTGPISENTYSYVEWENMWYNATVSKVVLTKLHIEYMDGTEEYIDGKDVVDTDSEDSQYYINEKKPKEEEDKKRAEEQARKEELEAPYKFFGAFKCLKKAKAAGFTDAFIKSESVPATEKTETPKVAEVVLAVGDKVKMAANATVYGKTTKFSSWVYQTILYVREIKDSRVTVSTQPTGAVTGAVDIKYLTKV